MAIFIPREGAGGKIGASFGTGLGKVFESLAEDKLKQMRQRSQAQQLQQGGLPEVLAYLDPQVQAQYLRGAQAAKIESQKQQQEMMSQALIDKLKMGSDNLSQQTVRDQSQDISAPVAIQQFVAGTPQTHESRLQSQNERLEEALDNPGINPKQKESIQLALDKNNERLDKIKQARQAKYGKELEKLHTEYTAAKERLDDYKRLDELNESGELPSTTFVSYLKGTGIDIPALLGESGEEFQKVTQNFVRRAKEYYGGRITDRELQQFLKTIPSLLQSPEGRKRVTAQMRRLDKMKTASYKEAQKIVQDNQGITPEDLWEQVDKRLKPLRKKFTDRFKEDLKKKVPEASSRLAVGAAHLAGLGTLPALGAGIGSLIPGVGTLAGAGIGAGLTGLGRLLRSLGS